jgi:hypothetical protein
MPARVILKSGTQHPYGAAGAGNSRAWRGSACRAATHARHASQSRSPTRARLRERPGGSMHSEEATAHSECRMDFSDGAIVRVSE